MLYKFWGVPPEIIEPMLSNVHQHIGSVSTHLPSKFRSGDRLDQIAEDIVRCAYVNTTGHLVQDHQVRLQSFCDETKVRLHRDGFLGLEIYVQPRDPMFLDYRIPLDGLTISLDGQRLATAEMCLGQHGQIYALFFREPIPISTDHYQWTLSLLQPHADFNYQEMEIYWIYGDRPIEPLTSTINVFQYGYTDWHHHPPFQAQEDGIYTNQMILDASGNVAGLRYSH
jgi:hypothetical protein